MQQGTAIRNFHVARQLARRHQVDLVAFGDPDATAAPLSEAGVDLVVLPPPPPRPYQRRFLELFATRTPDLARRLLHEPMSRQLSELACRGEGGAKYDILQVEGLEMALYGLQARADLLARAGRFIYDAHNAEWVLQHRAWLADIGRLRGLPGAGYSFLQTLKLRTFERHLLQSADKNIAVSEADARALLSLAPDADIEVVPNGVDLSSYEMADGAHEVPTLCVFVGKMDFRPNIDAMSWFCRKVWPKLRIDNPEAELAIVGRDPVARVRALAGPAITVTGAVDDVRPWLARAGIVVVPLRVGGGTRLKVLEAMAMAKAIVATSMAVEGLDLVSGAEVVTADTPDGQVAAISRLMRESGMRRELGRSARYRVERDYRWEELVPRIESLYS